MATRIERWLGALGVFCLLLGASSVASFDPQPYRLLKEPSTHAPGKVKMEVFVDFYCPHCHHFEAAVLPELQKEFGSKLEVMEIGFPVIRDRPRLPFELYEAARAERKGAAMAKALFRALQDEGKDIRDPAVEAGLIKEVGLDPGALKKRLASGEPKRALEAGIAQGERDGVRFTPTVLLDGYVLAEVTTAENLKPLIRKLLAGEKP